MRKLTVQEQAKKVQKVLSGNMTDNTIVFAIVTATIPPPPRVPSDFAALLSPKSKKVPLNLPVEATPKKRVRKKARAIAMLAADQ